MAPVGLANDPERVAVTEAISIAVTLTSDQVDAIARHVAELIAADKFHSAPSGKSRWVTPDEAATILRCGRKRIYTLVSDGRLNRHHEGRRASRPRRG